MNAVVLPQYGLTLCLAPKAANSSIKQTILDVMGEKTRGVGLQSHPALNRSDDLAKTFREYPDHLFAAAVRNPFDRLVSCYAQKICTHRCRSQRFDKLGFRQNMPFEDFVRQVAKNPGANIHFQPQWDLVGHRQPDMLVRFETLDADWRALCGRVGLPLVELPMMNQSEHRYWKDYYTNKSRWIAERIYADDCEAFRYAF